MEYVSTLALVINRKKTKEQDLVVTLLTPRLGKIFAIAKGAQNIKSRRLSHLQIGNIIKVHLYSKNNFYWITEAVSTESFLSSAKSVSQINLLFYFLEILNHFIAENQHIDQVFEISTKIIRSINKNLFVSYIKYEIKFLEVLGFGIPVEITRSFQEKNYQSTQKYIHKFLESLIDHPIQSKKLFS